MEILNSKALITFLFLLLLGWTFTSQAYSNQELANKCDALAGDPANPDTRGPGVKWGNIKPRSAIKACSEAVKANPNSLRLQSQLGRAFRKAKRHGEAFEWFDKAAKQGYAPAQYYLGISYSVGQGVRKDNDEAAGLFHQAAGQGYAPAKRYAKLFPLKTYSKEDLAKKCATLAGDPENLNSLTDMESWMTIVLPNALRICGKAVKASPNSPPLQYQYGRALGRAERWNESFQWIEKSAKQGYAPAQYLLALYSYYNRFMATVRIFIKNDTELFLKSAKQGYAPAQREVAELYLYGNMKGEGGIDEAKAFKWFSEAARQGRADAQFALGVMYGSDGNGVPKDAAKAAEWYLKAAEQGNTKAQFAIGDMYEKGKGVPKDEKKAIHWFIKAEEKRYTHAVYRLGVMFANRKGRRGWPLIFDASERGHKDAKLLVENERKRLNGLGADRLAWKSRNCTYALYNVYDGYGGFKRQETREESCPEFPAHLQPDPHEAGFRTKSVISDFYKGKTPYQIQMKKMKEQGIGWN